MKKRKGAASLPKALRTQSVSYSSPSVVRKARNFPILECWISSSWREETPGLVQIVIARQQPDENVCFGTYLVDKLCLGLKNTFAKANYSYERYQREIHQIFHRSEEAEPESCPPELAHQMIYAAIDYAKQFGFEPQKDFELTQNMLEPRGELAETYKITFGKDGKPLFVAGPNDDTQAIINQLEKTAGPGNYDYVAMAPGMF